MQSAPTKTIEVFAEIGCPFTHIGLRRFVERRTALGRDDVVLHVRSWPLELVNGKALDPHFVGEEVDELRAQVAPTLFAGFDAETFPTTSFPAFAVAAAAYERNVWTGEAVSLELRDRFFEQGEDITDPDVLEDVAAVHGLGHVDLEGRAAARYEFEMGQSRDVVGSPHFFTPSGNFFCPALEIEKVDGHLQITADPDGFERFVDASLG